MLSLYQDILLSIIVALVVILIVFTIHNRRLRNLKDELIEDVNAIFRLNGIELDLLEKYSKACNDAVKNETVEGISVNNEERRKQLAQFKMKIRNCL